LSNQEKVKLSVNGQIAKLKEKGITFNITNEQKAENFLIQNSYFFRIKSYCKNYNKINDKYHDLEFAYLVDLSTIDMHFRRFITRLTLDIEHVLKTKLIADFNNTKSDGYDVIEGFFGTPDGKECKAFLQKIFLHSTNNQQPSFQIIKKYHLQGYPIWAFVEVIQFGHLKRFYDYFYKLYPNKKYKSTKDNIFRVQCLRNAAAHDNCLLHSLKTRISDCPKNSYNYLISNRHSIFNKQIECFKNIDNQKIEELLKNQTVGDFVSSLLVFNEICTSQKMKYHCYKELKTLFSRRFARNRLYYQNNLYIVDAYYFLLAIVRFFFKNAKVNN